MMFLNASSFLYGERVVADVHLHPGDTGTDLSRSIAEQVDADAFYEQDHDHASFGMGYLGEGDTGHEGGKAVAMMLASVVGMFVVQRVKKYVDTHGDAPTTALARISLEFE